MTSWAEACSSTTNSTPLSPLSPHSINALSNLQRAQTIIMTPSKPLFSLPSPPETPRLPTSPRRSATQARTFRQSLYTRHAPRPSANPLTRSPRKLHKQQRDAFLGRVQQHREMKQWHTRSEQILQTDYLAQQRAWEAEQARLAPDIDPDEVDLDRTLENDDANDAATSTQVPAWLTTQASQDSYTTASALDSQQMHTSQPSQDQHPWYTRAELPQHAYRLDNATEQAEIDAILEAEAREMDALVALHEASASDHDQQSNAWAELPQQSLGLGATTMSGQVIAQNVENNRSSPPLWGSDDADFEEELWRLGADDAMDTSGG